MVRKTTKLPNKQGGKEKERERRGLGRREMEKKEDDLK